MNAIHHLTLADRGLITIGGPDRKTYLQGLISNDIEKVGPERAIWAALLTSQGKFLHDFFIIEIGEVFYLDCEAARLMDLGRRLSRFKLRAAVDLGIDEDFSVSVAFGRGVFTRLGVPHAPGAAVRLGGGVVYCEPRLSDIGVRAVLPATSTEAFWTKANFEPGSPEEYDRLRISLGLPDGSRDMVVEKAILLENNFDQLHGVDWDKGCYVGQELTARTKYRGLIKKRLMPVQISGKTPAIGASITAAGRDVGEIRSVVGDMALALLRMELIKKAKEDGIPLISGDAVLALRPPEWLSN